MSSCLYVWQQSDEKTNIIACLFIMRIYRKVPLLYCIRWDFLSLKNEVKKKLGRFIYSHASSFIKQEFFFLSFIFMKLFLFLFFLFLSLFFFLLSLRRNIVSLMFFKKLLYIRLFLSIFLLRLFVPASLSLSLSFPPVCFACISKTYITLLIKSFIFWQFSQFFFVLVFFYVFVSYSRYEDLFFLISRKITQKDENFFIAFS